MRCGTKNTQNLFIKNCIFILTCLNFSCLQSTFHLMQYTYADNFPQLRTVFELVNFDTPFSASAVSCFTSSTSAKRFPLRTFINQENKNQSCSRRDRMNREGGAQGSCCFWSKLLNTQHGCGQVRL